MMAETKLTPGVLINVPLEYQPIECVSHITETEKTHVRVEISEILPI